MSLNLQPEEYQILFRLEALENEYGQNRVKTTLRLLLSSVSVHGTLSLHLQNLLLSYHTDLLTDTLQRYKYI